MGIPADVLTGHDLELIAAVQAAYPDASAFQIASAIYDGRTFGELEQRIWLYLASSQLPAEGDELDLRAQWGDR